MSLEPGNVYCMDCFDGMDALEPASVDAFIGDPPYELTELAFDKQSINWPLFWEKVKRVLKRPSSPVILTSQQPFTTDLINSNRTWFRTEIIYEKTMPTGYLNAKVYPLRCHENIIVFAAAAPDYYPQFEDTTDIAALARNRTYTAHYNKHEDKTYEDTGKRYPRSVWRFAQRRNAFKNTETRHPTEKPYELMERIILNFTAPNAFILDGFCGGGSTLYAAARTGRRWVGFDTDPEHVANASKWLSLPVDAPLFAEVGA